MVLISGFKNGSLKGDDKTFVLLLSDNNFIKFYEMVSHFTSNKFSIASSLSHSINKWISD